MKRKNPSAIDLINAAMADPHHEIFITVTDTKTKKQTKYYITVNPALTTQEKAKRL